MQHKINPHLVHRSSRSAHFNARRCVACILAACLAMLLSGCATIGSLFGGKSDRYLEEVPSTLVIERVWSASAVGNFEEDYLPLMPLVEDGRVYVCGPNGRVAAFAMADGERLWRATVDEDLVAGVGGGDGVLLVGTARGEVLAIDEDSKIIVWRRALGSRALAISQNHRNTTLVRSEDNTTFAFRSDDGKPLWRRKDPPPPLTIKGASVPLFYEDLVFLGLDDGQVLIVALRDGKVLNQITLGVSSGESDLDRIVDIDGRMLIDDDTFFATAYQGRAIALDLRRNRLLWLADAPSHVGLDVGRKGVYATTPDNQLVAHDRLSGKRLWSNNRLLDTALSAPLAVEPFVAVGSDRGDIYWLSSRDGRVLERRRVGGEAIAALIPSGRLKLIAFDKGGKLTALRVKGYRKKSQ